MKFKEFDVVRLLVEPDDELRSRFTECDEEFRAGDIGTVVMVYENPYEGYEVEFLYEDEPWRGYTKALGTLYPEELELVQSYVKVEAEV